VGGIARRLEKLEALMPETENPSEYAATHEMIRRALDRIALLRVRQGVAAEDLNLETEEDREACAIFEALREHLEWGEG
jgi:hypothetical protein